MLLVWLTSGVHSLLHLPVSAGGAGALLQPGHLLPVHQSEGGNSSSHNMWHVSRIICNITPLIAAEDHIQHDADEPTRRRASGDGLWDSSRLLGFCKVDVQMWEDLFTMVLFQIWVGHGVFHVSSNRLPAHLPWDCGHLQSDSNIALQILCHNLERGNRSDY